MDSTPPGSTAHPLGEKVSRNDPNRGAHRNRVRSERRKRRARTAFTILFLVGTLFGSLFLISRGCQADDGPSGATASGG